MPKEKPHHGGGPIRGDDTHSIAQDEHSGKIPTAAIVNLERELTGMFHGTASLTIHIRAGRFVRFTTGRECSHMAGDDNDK